MRVAYYNWEYPNPKPRSRAPGRSLFPMPAYQAKKQLPAGAKPVGPPEWRVLPLPGEYTPTHGQPVDPGFEARRASWPLLLPGDPGHPDNE